jgi:hypothetical protein
MPCACGGKGKSALYDVEVTFRDGTKQVFGSRVEARLAISAAGGGGTMKSVPKAT